MEPSDTQIGGSSPDATLDASDRAPADPPTHRDGRISESYAAIWSNISQSLSPSLSLRWCPTSEEELAKAEGDLLSSLSRPFRTYFVDIGSGWGLSNVKIRTLEMLTDIEESKLSFDADARRTQEATSLSQHSETAKKTAEVEIVSVVQKKSPQKQPLLMVHGFAAGIGTWILNLDTLASETGRKVYAIDVIGFARSTRAQFDLSGDVEGQFIDSIERWREKMGIEKFILLGHSFGGYLSASYALKHPERVSHVILADPWGIQDRQSTTRTNTYRFPIWVRAVNSIFQAFNPLAVLRVTGPYGPTLVHRFRGDLREKFRPKLQEDSHKFLSYIYHCNAQTATGESAFKALALPYGWPKNPLIHRLIDLNQSVSLTFIYGSRSWIERAPGEFLRGCMPDRVSVDIIQGSGHHVYADKYEEFNRIVQETCSKITG